MIVFDLSCDKGHVFEAWFKDGATFERARKRRQLNCSICGSAKIDKAPMAPAVGRGGRERSQPMAVRVDPEAAQAAALMTGLTELRQKIEESCDHVGERFAEEARAMHYGEKKKRSIYGEASDEQAQELHEEGIKVSRIPWIARRDS